VDDSAKPSGGLALAPAQRFNDNSPVRCGEPAEGIRIGGLHDPAARFNRDRDRMGVREKRGTRARLGEQRPDEASQAAIGVTKQQPLSRLAGEERVQRLIASGSPVQLSESSRRDRDLAAQPARCFHGTSDVPLGRMPRIKQRAHRLGVEHKPHQPTRSSLGSRHAAEQAHVPRDLSLVFGRVQPAPILGQVIKEIRQGLLPLAPDELRPQG
jgi:hypothetical protein